MDMLNIPCFLLILLWMWTGKVSANIGRCPDTVKTLTRPYYHVETFNDMCYAFHNRERTWVDANSHCKRLGAQMISITNEDIMNFVKRVLNSQSLRWSNKGVWNGANDIDGRGWKWTTGEKIRWNYWQPGEPSKTFGLFSFEDCACMRRGDSWRWHDYPCDGSMWTYKYICQFPMKPGSTAGNSAQQGSSLTSSEKDENKALLIGMVIGGVALFSLTFLAIIILYRKKRKQKLQNEEPSVRFQNLAYAQVGQTDRDPNRPDSDIYMDTNTMNRLYEEINKETEYGINTLGAKGACCTYEETCSSEGTSDDPKACFTKHSSYPDEPPPSYDEVAEAVANEGNEYIDMASAGAKNIDEYLEPNNVRSPGREYIDMRQKDTNRHAKANSASLLHKPSNLELTHIYHNEDPEEDDRIHQTKAKREEAYAQPSETEPHLSSEETTEYDPVYEEIKDVSRPDEILLIKDNQ